MNRSPRSPIAIEPTRIRRRRVGCDDFKLVVGQGLLLLFIPESGYQVSTLCAIFGVLCAIFGVLCAISAFSALSLRSLRLGGKSFPLYHAETQRTQRLVDNGRLQIADFRLQISDR